MPIWKKKTETSDLQLIRQHPNDAGLDIISAEDATIWPGCGRVFKTGLFVAIPAGSVGIVKARSGMSIKHDIEIGAGVIDSGYRGEVAVKLYNFGTGEYRVKKGDRIAQLLIMPIQFSPVVDVYELPYGDRGAAGFGSTGA